MANDAHLEMLRRGASIWNEWRRSTGLETPDFDGADLSVDSVGLLDLNGINLANALLNGVSLTGQCLERLTCSSRRCKGQSCEA